MLALRPSASLVARGPALRGAKATTTTSSSTTTIPRAAPLSATAAAAAAAAPFSTTARRPAGGGMQYDPPSGWLWGVRPGEKYQNEGWEGPFFYGFWGSIIVAMVAYAYKPDTSIQTWALEEARRRLEAEGILEDPEKK